MKFSEMPYERPDLDKVKRELGDLTGRLKAAESYEEARAVFLEKEGLALKGDLGGGDELLMLLGQVVLPLELGHDLRGEGFQLGANGTRITSPSWTAFTTS